MSVVAELRTRKEAAEILRICTRSVDRLIAEGKLRAVKIGTAVRIHQDSIDEIARNGET